MSDQLPILVVILPLTFALVTPLLGWWRRGLCQPWVVLGLGLAGLAAAGILVRVVRFGPIHYYMGSWVPPWGIEFVIDPLNAMMLVLVTLTAFLVAVYARESVQQELAGRTVYFYTLYLLQVTGFLGIVVTGDMFNLYVFLEITSLTGYALIAVGEKDAPFYSFRYLIMGTVGASFYLLGVGYLYIATGSLNMADLARLLPDLYGSNVVRIAFAFFILGLSVKMALFPLHNWLPDAYAKAPSTSSALIAPLMTKVAVYVLIRILYSVFRPSFGIETLPAAAILHWVGIAAIIAGAVMALAQTDFKRMLGYIIVAEIGYMVGGVGVAQAVAVRGVILHILNDAVMTLGLFAVAGIINFRFKTHAITDFRALFQTMPWTMAALVVVALSIIGVPPTCGFFSKWYLIQGAIAAGCWVYVAALLFSSLVNVVLFFRIFEIGYVFHLEPGPAPAHGTGAGVSVREAPLSMLIPTLMTALLILLIGLYNQAIVTRIIDLAVPKL